MKKPEIRLAAGKEYHRKTTCPHQMWATDASYFRVVGWGYYYLVTVMDDYSRFILAYRLQRDMTSDSFIEVVQDAVDRIGMDQIPITDRSGLLSDNGPAMYQEPSETTWAWWASSTSWQRPSTLRPTVSWSATDLTP